VYQWLYARGSTYYIFSSKRSGSCIRDNKMTFIAFSCNRIWQHISSLRPFHRCVTSLTSAGAIFSRGPRHLTRIYVLDWCVSSCIFLFLINNFLGSNNLRMKHRFTKLSKKIILFGGTAVQCELYVYFLHFLKSKI